MHRIKTWWTSKKHLCKFTMGMWLLKRSWAILENRVEMLCKDPFKCRWPLHLLWDLILKNQNVLQILNLYLRLEEQRMQPKTEVQKTFMSSKRRKIWLMRLLAHLLVIVLSRQNDRWIRPAANMRRPNLLKEQSRKWCRLAKRKIIKWWWISNLKGKWKCKRQQKSLRREWIYKNTISRSRSTKLLSKKDLWMTNWQSKGLKCSFSFQLQRETGWDKVKTMQLSLLAQARREWWHHTTSSQIATSTSRQAHIVLWPEICPKILQLARNSPKTTALKGSASLQSEKLSKCSWPTAPSSRLTLSSAKSH